MSNTQRHAGRYHRFVNGQGIVRNSRYNLLKKIEDLRFAEAIEEIQS